MTARRYLFIGSLLLTLIAGAIGFAQAPPDRVSGARHENLAAAQQLVEQAYQKIEAAQRANHSDLGGHAKKAEELLTQANHELGMAADTANQDHR